MIWEAVPGSTKRRIRRGEKNGKEAQAQCKWAVTGALGACTEHAAVNHLRARKVDIYSTSKHTSLVEVSSGGTGS